MGVFAAPTPTEAQVKRQYGVSVLGRTREIVASFYAVSLDRRLKHPAVIAISEVAQQVGISVLATEALHYAVKSGHRPCGLFSTSQTDWVRS